MAAVDDPTPCPRPRTAAVRRTSVLGNDRNSDFIASLGAVKPRRPRASRVSFGWDPTVDIYDDTFTFSNQVPSQRWPSQEPVLAKARRSTLFAKPAQRPSGAAVGDGNRSVQDAPARRTSIVQFPPSELQTVQDHKDNVRPGCGSTEMRKNPRRRTIYVPADDTTIMTIHPGAPLGQGQRPVLPSARDPNLRQLAAVTEESNNSLASRNQLGKQRRQSLAAAPRRAPLQRAACAEINRNDALADMPGTGGGKENVPPHPTAEHVKGVRRSSIFSKSDAVPRPAMNHRNARPSSVACMPMLREAGSPLQHPTFANKQLSSTKESPPVAIPVKARHRPSMLQMPRANTEHGEQMSRRCSLMDLGAPMHARRNARSVAQKSGSQALDQRTGAYPASKYPVLLEDIHQPSLYEESWLSQQELAVTQLINSLLGNNTNKGVENGQVSTRKLLMSLYQQPSMPLLYKRLQASLRFGALQLSDDIVAQVARVKHDVGQRQRFLDLWLKTYNLNSLRAVCEVVIGRQMPNYSQGDSQSPSSPTTRRRKQAKALELFIKTFLINNEDKIKSRATGVGAPGCSPPSQAKNAPVPNVAVAWRRTVLRSLMIVFLLDKAQQMGVFVECLFQPSSPFKSSSAVLQSLTMLLLPSVGDISRVLGHLNYEVRHVQHPLQEHDYFVTNLATDLRDGVVLSRLVETLLYPTSARSLLDDREDVTLELPGGDMLTSRASSEQGRLRVLCQHLKYPCVSRVQKLYNVQISLGALASLKGVSRFVHEIRAEDIVDGHREKTVGFLWSLMGRWGLEALLDLDLLEKELGRLQKEILQRRLPSEADAEMTCESDPHQNEGGLERCTALLKKWATNVAQLRGISVHNLSTSFADGNVYNAIAAEYKSALESCNDIDDGKPTVDRAHQASTRSMLKTLGCSEAFADMFRSGGPIPSAQTTVPLLAFLASRLLPLSEPYFAAKTIQRAWRIKQSRMKFRRRLVLACLAHDCAAVVQTRERIIWAVLVIQRRWREVLRGGKYAASQFWNARTTRHDIARTSDGD